MAPKALKIFLSTTKKLVDFFTKYMANDDFSEPPRRADSKNPIFSFSRFFGLGHLRGPGVSLGRILGVLSIEPLLGEGAGEGRALSTPPPLPETKTRPPQQWRTIRTSVKRCWSKSLDQHVLKTLLFFVTTLLSNSSKINIRACWVVAFTLYKLA